MDHQEYQDDNTHESGDQYHQGDSSICQDLLEQGPDLIEQIAEYFHQQHGGDGYGRRNPILSFLSR